MTAGFAENGPATPAGAPAPVESDRTGSQPPRVEPPRVEPTSGWPAPGSGTGAFAPVPLPPPVPARRPVLPTVLAVLLAVVVVAQAAVLVLVERQLTAANRKIDSLSATDGQRLHDVTGRVQTLERQAAKNLDAASVAQSVLPSVFKITVPNGSATAFAIGTSTNGTDLLTNYHVVQAMWNQGQRTATIDHDNLRFPVTVVRVDPDNDVALLYSNEKFPRIAVATGTVAAGTPVVALGAPQGFEQSVSGGVVSSLRTDVPGQAGKKLIQFDAAVNPGNSGGPLVNAQKQVIGIVEESFSGEGLHFAIPISVACTSFSGLC
jgi:putative serine protease PepD